MTAGLHTTIRAAIYDTLRLDAALQALGASGSPTQIEIYSGMAPDGAATPYLTVSGGTAQEWDTKDSDGIEAEVQVHTWTDRWRGELQATEIMDAVSVALDDAPLTLTGGALLWATVKGTVGPTLDPDGRTLHGVIRVVVVADET